jgi:hypothetical protein
MMTLVELVLATMASMVVLASAQPEVWNASAPPTPILSNASYAWRAACRVPTGAVSVWWNNKPHQGPYACYGANGQQMWSMLNAYRAGGTQQIHWKFTDQENDVSCLRDWDYYDKDGTTLIATIKGRTTRIGATRSWCATNVYQSGGVENYQWAYCTC